MTGSSKVHWYVQPTFVTWLIQLLLFWTKGKKRSHFHNLELLTVTTCYLVYSPSFKVRSEVQLFKMFILCFANCLVSVFSSNEMTDKNDILRLQLLFLQLHLSLKQCHAVYCSLIHTCRVSISVIWNVRLMCCNDC